MDEVLAKIEANIIDTKKVLHILEQNKIDIALAKEATDDIEKEQMTLKKDKNQILLQQRDANLKSMEQMKQLKVISKNLDDLIISYKVQAPYTSSWKSEEALTEIKNFTSKLVRLSKTI